MSSEHSNPATVPLRIFKTILEIIMPLIPWHNLSPILPSFCFLSAAFPLSVVCICFISGSSSWLGSFGSIFSPCLLALGGPLLLVGFPRKHIYSGVDCRCMAGSSVYLALIVSVYSGLLSSCSLSLHFKSIYGGLLSSCHSVGCTQPVRNSSLIELLIRRWTGLSNLPK